MIVKIMLTFLKIGFWGFGGGYAMLSLIFEEAAKFGMTIDEFADLNALDVLIPGPIAINSATYVGQLYGGFLGALVATFAVSVPSLIFVPLFMRYEEKINSSRYLNAALTSVKAASVGLIFGVALSIMLATTFNISHLFDWQHINFDWLSFMMMAAAFVLHTRYEISPIVLTLLAGIVGWIAYFI
ncbi:chromate transporter [Mobilisporobacter senegalensis]|uniref:Chromate transporter n=1 Tax=Mobilisporobacter senegalensis TaxID=1329262 RepID=A0A3N1XZ29_9FIRM|nr:chromate transporter [Mobilisporobacter senegalensis]ROR31855.1 chromate transporter [Mobilisporobacter senegalensis]